MPLMLVAVVLVITIQHTHCSNEEWDDPWYHSDQLPDLDLQEVVHNLR